MPSCEDFPCCGHEVGCCPDFDESGKQLNMKCVCGATVPLGGSSLCQGCLVDPDDPYDGYYDPPPEACGGCRLVDDCECDCEVCEEWVGDCECEKPEWPEGCSSV